MSFLARFALLSAFPLVASVSSGQQISPYTARIEVLHGKPYAMVMVNGQGPFRFVIDTGTGGPALVAPELADRLHLPAAGEARLTDPSGQGERREELVLIDSIEVAGVEFSEVKAVRHRLPDEDGSCLGLLGFPLFHNYRLQIDYPNRLLNLSLGALEPDGGRSVLPFRMPNGVPIVPLRVGNVTFEAQFDSGGTGLSLPERLVSRLRLASDPILIGTGQSLATRYQVRSAKLADDVHLGRYTFGQPVVEINPAFPIANFGSRPLENFVVTFDQRSLLMRLDAPRDSFRLDIAPTTLRMKNASPPRSDDPSLVPVG